MFEKIIRNKIRYIFDKLYVNIFEETIIYIYYVIIIICTYIEKLLLPQPTYKKCYLYFLLCILLAIKTFN